MSKVNFKVVLYFMFVLMIPMDENQMFAMNIAGVRITILDLLLVVMFYLVLIEILIVRGLKVGRFGFRVLLTMLLLCIVSWIGFINIPADNIIYDVKMSLNFIEFTVLILVTLFIVDSEEKLRLILIAVMICALVIAVATTLMSLGFDIPGYVRARRMEVGPFMAGNIALMGRVLQAGLISCLALPVVMTDDVVCSKYLKAPIVALLLLLSVLSVTRGIWIAISIQIILVIGAALLERRASLHYRMAIVVTMTAVSIMIVQGWNSIYSSVVNIRSETYYHRFQLIYDSLEYSTASLANFLFGAGKSRFVEMYSGVMVHNYIFDILASKGFLSVLLVLYLQLSILVMLLRLTYKERPSGPIYKRRPLMFAVALIGCNIIGMTGPIESSMAFWVVLSIICAYINNYERQHVAV